MRALVCIGGDAPPASFLRILAEGADLVIAADSGLASAAGAGLTVDHAIGDMDSLQDHTLLERIPPGRVHRHPPEKDFTDTELALSLAWDLGADRVVLAGGGGGRLDHLLAIRSLFDRARTPDEWHTALESVYLARPGGVVNAVCMPGALVSVFPCSSAGASGMESEGLTWPLRGLVWGPGEYGVSNRCPGGAFRVQAGAEPLLVVMERYAPRSDGPAFPA